MSSETERNAEYVKKVSELTAVFKFFPGLTSRELVEFAEVDRNGLNEIKALVAADNAKG